MEKLRAHRFWPGLVACVAVLLIAVSGWQLAGLRGGVSLERLMLGETPATIYRPEGAQDAPLVVVVHGFAGSRQMMSAISLTLARAGFAVVAFDFIGHGRHRGLMSADVGRIEGTTSYLVTQTREVVAAARGLPGVDATAPMALVGHSMATDVIIRAAQTLPDIAAVVAVSMYSDAVIVDYPERLLVLSGQWEPRLREVGLEAAQMVDPGAVEGTTVRAGSVIRRTVAAPNVEHVGVLYAATTLSETRDWIAAALGVTPPPGARLATIGPWMLALLAGVVLAFVPLSRLAGPRIPADPLSLRSYALALGVPVLPAVALTVLSAGVGPVAGFVPLSVFFGTWGLAQLAVLWRFGWRPDPPQTWALALLLAWGLVFALTMDRVFAAFVPAGPRVWLMILLLLGTVPFGLADAWLAEGAAVWRRVLARLIVLGALMAAILLVPMPLGLVFTVVPVLVLFWLVYGTFGRWVGARAGAVTAGLGSGVALAWAIAASTPIFAFP